MCYVMDAFPQRCLEISRVGRFTMFNYVEKKRGCYVTVSNDTVFRNNTTLTISISYIAQEIYLCKDCKIIHVTIVNSNISDI